MNNRYPYNPDLTIEQLNDVLREHMSEYGNAYKLLEDKIKCQRELIKSQEGAIQMLENELSGRDWQPIETVPMDKTQILIYLSVTKNTIQGRFDNCGMLVNCWCSCIDVDTYKPTLWMPIPEVKK